MLTVQEDEPTEKLSTMQEGNPIILKDNLNVVSLRSLLAELTINPFFNITMEFCISNIFMEGN